MLLQKHYLFFKPIRHRYIITIHQGAIIISHIIKTRLTRFRMADIFLKPNYFQNRYLFLKPIDGIINRLRYGSIHDQYNLRRFNSLSRINTLNRLFEENGIVLLVNRHRYREILCFHYIKIY